jgi:hypothetical protein
MPNKEEEPRLMSAAGYVYAFRYGDGDHVKIGRTNDLAKRRRALQGAHHNLLVLADSIEHDDYKEGEKYLHRLLKDRKVPSSGTGSREHFDVGDAELALAFDETRRYLNWELPRRRELPKLEVLETGDDVLKTTQDMQVVKHRHEEVRARLSRAQAQIDRLDDEVSKVCQPVYERQRAERERLNRVIHEVAVDEAELVTTVKMAIGPAAGIEGVATWKSVAGPRRFDSEWVKADDPEQFERYRTAFDAPRFRKEQPAAYEAHMRVTTHRRFEWVDEVDIGTNEQGPGRGQSERQSVRARAFRIARPVRRIQR